VVPPWRVAENLRMKGGLGPAEVAAGRVIGVYAVIPWQLGGLPVGFGQTLLEFTMKRAVLPAFDPVYCSRRIPDCTAIVTGLGAMLATFTHRIIWVLSGMIHAGWDWVCAFMVKLNALKSKNTEIGPKFKLTVEAVLMTICEPPQG